MPSSPDSSTIQVCGAWVGVLPRLADEMHSEALIFAAVKAFGTAILDRGPDGKRMNFRSLEAYSSTLQHLQHDLVASKMSFDIKTAASIACLAMVEVSAGAVILVKEFCNNHYLSVDISDFYRWFLRPLHWTRCTLPILPAGLVQF